MCFMDIYADAITYQNFDEIPVTIAGDSLPIVLHHDGHGEEFRLTDYSVEFADERILEHAIDGKLYFGVSPPGRRSAFDEHAWFDGERYLPRIPNESCISLGARYLTSPGRNGDESKRRPITDFPEIKREIDYLTFTDLNAVQMEDDPFFMESFPYLVKAMHIHYPNDPRFVQKWLRHGMNAKRDVDWGGDNFTLTHACVLMGQLTEFAKHGPRWRREWHDIGMEALDNDQRLFKSGRDKLRALMSESSVQLISPLGEKINFAWVESDNPRIGSAGRSLGCHLLLQVTSDGHMQLYSDYRVNKGKGINLDRVAAAVQLAEQRAQVRHGWLPGIITDDSAVLRREGFPFWGSVWYYVYGMLLNGSLTRPAVPISLLEPDFLFELVQEELRKDGYTIVP